MFCFSLSCLRLVCVRHFRTPCLTKFIQTQYWHNIRYRSTVFHVFDSHQCFCDMRMIRSIFAILISLVHKAYLNSTLVLYPILFDIVTNHRKFHRARRAFAIMLHTDGITVFCLFLFYLSNNLPKQIHRAQGTFTLHGMLRSSSSIDIRYHTTLTEPSNPQVQDGWNSRTTSITSSLLAHFLC